MGRKAEKTQNFKPVYPTLYNSHPRTLSCKFFICLYFTSASNLHIVVNWLAHRNQSPYNIYFFLKGKLFKNIILYIFMAKWNDCIYLSLSWGNFQQMLKFVLLAQGFKFKLYDFSNITTITGWILVPSKGWKFTVQIKDYSKLEENNKLKTKKKNWWMIFPIKLRIWE